MLCSNASRYKIMMEGELCFAPVISDSCLFFLLTSQGRQAVRPVSRYIQHITYRVTSLKALEHLTGCTYPKSCQGLPGSCHNLQVVSFPWPCCYCCVYSSNVQACIDPTMMSGDVKTLLPIPHQLPISTLYFQNMFRKLRSIIRGFTNLMPPRLDKPRVRE